MASFRDLLAQAKTVITEVDTTDAASRIERGVIVLDVREPDEYEQGALPSALHIPRGHLEAQIETKIVDKSAPIVVYCAGGVRSAFAAKTLAELGYTDVVSMAGGFGKWKDEGRAWKTPVTLNAEQKIRYQRHLLLPEVGIEGQAKLLASKVLMLGAGGLGSPAALYLAAAGVGTLSILSRRIEAKVPPQGRFIDIDGNSICRQSFCVEVSDIFVDRDIGPVLSQNRAAVRFDFTERHRSHSGALKPQTETPNSAEQVQYIHKSSLQ